ncbi:conserved hypothetical protein [Hyphomicrobiales bacterium]|jgi:hypothetical protein|nr:conserved hypothetical protein [Hyphomicrobiales bacterium]CAH1702314.1 conserved hypothetical protein [Hyphomicrobiales bacterium]CAI0346516.1 conserved hypothetical protein [Hyphomicrobiales bacterium]
MTTLQDLQSFDLQAAEVTVWVFRKPRTKGEVQFRGRWIGITEDLAGRLRDAVQTNLEGITETIEYGVLAQNNEGSALTIDTDETVAHRIAAQIMEPTDGLKVRNLADLKDTDFYVARFALADQVMLAVRKTDASWSTRKSGGLIRMVYSDDELDVDDDPAFTIRPDFDFFVLTDRIFIRSKPRFESLLAYREGHERVFEELRTEAEFAAIFADMGPLTAYVGTNKIHLRRAVAIQQKGHYRDVAFMQRLRAQCENMNLNIAFDEGGRIVATVESGRDIFIALLDHRLESRLSAQMYDVPSTELVG